MLSLSEKISAKGDNLKKHKKTVDSSYYNDNMNDNSTTTDNERCRERMNTIKPNYVVPALTDEQRENFENGLGMSGVGENCDDLNGELLCDIRQCLEYVIEMGIGNVFANEDSKCREGDLSPTLASMWSRIYRFAQAVTSILCGYDPFISTLLKSGKYPEVLMGAQTVSDGEMDGCCKRVGYPTWVAPDDDPSLDSSRPVSARGVAKAVNDAILSVWHRWEEEPEFTFFAETKDDLDEQSGKYGVEENDTALIAHSDECEDGTAIYEYAARPDEGEEEVKWRLKSCVVDGDEHNLVNFAVTHIVKGKYAENGMYYFDGTWQMLDADLGGIEAKLEELEERFRYAVKVPEDTKPTMIVTVPTVAEATDYPCDPNRQTIVLIAG